MIVNVNMCASMFDETLHVMKFSAIAKKVLNRATPDSWNAFYHHYNQHHHQYKSTFNTATTFTATKMYTATVIWEQITITARPTKT